MDNKTYWNEMNAKYHKSWENHAQKIMSEKELSFLERYLAKTKGKRILDIGVGTGRIVESYTKINSVDEIYGIDISENMLEFTKQRLGEQSKINQLKVVDISKEEIPFDTKFDFISTIRVLKYIPNWKATIAKIMESLVEDGIFVFTVSNFDSLNRFVPVRNPMYWSTAKELKLLADELGAEILEIRTYTRIPDAFYMLSGNKLYAKILHIAERLLELIFGKVLFGRILFVAMRKINSK